jgi:hypothetical protein
MQTTRYQWQNRWRTWWLSAGAACCVSLGLRSAEPGYPIHRVTNNPAPAAITSTTTPAATPAPPPAAPAQRSAADLERLALPIALHPDPLIAILLPASAYPLEIVQAARLVKDTNNLAKVDQQPWDDNVKAVAKFPELIAKMDADLSWTVELGQAFVNQPKELMDTIQSLRSKAQKAGTLQSTTQQVVTVTNLVTLQTNVTQVVTVTNQIVQIQPANPQVVYVPTYPTSVYYPQPAYVYDPYAPLVAFGVGIAIGAIIANNCDRHGGCVWVGGGGMVVWGGGYHGDVDVDIDIDRNVNRGDRPTQPARDRATTTGARPAQQKWQPDQGRMQANAATSPSIANREARGWGSATTRPASPATGTARPATAPAGGAKRPTTGAGAARPTAGTVPAARPAPASAAARPSASPTVSAPSFSRPASPAVNPATSRSPSSGSAFSGMSSGAGARNYSSRGAVSRGGGGGRVGGRR